MTRADVAYLMIAVLLALGGLGVLLSSRYVEYRRQVMRGHRHLKPPWKPFWMN